MHANIVCSLYILSQNLNAPGKHSMLQQYRTDKFNTFWPGAAAFRDKWALAAAYQKPSTEIGKPAIKNHYTAPVTAQEQPEFIESWDQQLFQGPATLLPTSETRWLPALPTTPGSAPRVRERGPQSPHTFQRPSSSTRAENPPKKPTHFAVEVLFFRLRFAIFCLNFLGYGAHPARPAKKK